MIWVHHPWCQQRIVKKHCHMHNHLPMSIVKTESPYEMHMTLLYNNHFWSTEFPYFPQTLGSGQNLDLPNLPNVGSQQTLTAKKKISMSTTLAHKVHPEEVIESHNIQSNWSTKLVKNISMTIYCPSINYDKTLLKVCLEQAFKKIHFTRDKPRKTLNS